MEFVSQIRREFSESRLVLSRLYILFSRNDDARVLNHFDSTFRQGRDYLSRKKINGKVSATADCRLDAAVEIVTPSLILLPLSPR
jgi:hypothetical protein